MKRAMLLSLGILLLGALAVDAGVITVQPERSSYSATLDQVIFRIKGVGVDNTDIPLGDVISVMLGTWTANGGAWNLPPATPPTTWAGKLSNDANAQDSDGGWQGVGPTTPQSWLNFSTKTADPSSRTGLVSGTLYNQFSIGYNASAAAEAAYCLGAVDQTPGEGLTDGYYFDNTILAVMYVSKSTTFAPGETIYTGGVGYALPLGGGAGYSAQSSVQIVPEPSTIALLGCGLFGLLAYAWRKRK
jgi:hypothetical protein